MESDNIRWKNMQTAGKEQGFDLNKLQKKMVTWRRDFHRYPEKGWLEMRTASRIARILKDLGYEVLTGKAVCEEASRMGLPTKEELEAQYLWAGKNGADPEYLEEMKDGFTGVIGILHCGRGPVTALRFDMDALGVYEKKEGHRPQECGFASCREGVMHACGHDGHMAMGLGTAEILSGMRSQLSGTIKLIFQPAEEGVRGAKSIVDKGHLDDVDVLLGIHLMQSEDGTCYVSPGMAGTLATTKLDVLFQGKASHAGISPQEGNNAMLAAAAAVLNLHAIPRHAEGSSRVNVGTLRAGTGRNVICDRAVLELETRGETTEINRYMEAYARRILQGAAMMHGCEVSCSLAGASAAMECSPELASDLWEICEQKLKIPVKKPRDMGGSEDFAYMAERVLQRGGQVCFNGVHTPCADALHGSGFDFEEQVLAMGVRCLCGVVAQLSDRIVC